MKKSALILLNICIQVTAAIAQVESPPCTLSNPNLIKELKGGVVGRIDLWNFASSYSEMASSYGEMASSTLRPNGQNPYDNPTDEKYQKIIKEDGENGEDGEVTKIKIQNAREDWECQYSAYNLSDGLPSTAWVEGVDGDGIGEVVLVHIDINKPAIIWAGYGKSDALFKANNRPAKVKVYLLGSSCNTQVTQYSVIFPLFKVAGTKELVLKDVNGFQPLELPAIQDSVRIEGCKEGSFFYFLAIEIRSVYKGTRYSDTWISEVQQPVGWGAPLTTALDLDYGYGIADAPVATVGSQAWLGKNLNVDHFANGDPIPEARTTDEWERADENKLSAWCYFKNDPANGRTYGRLYNWYAVNDPRGLAPKGWHIPSNHEWDVLTYYLGVATAGPSLKSTYGWPNNGNNGNGNNRSGIAGLPGGSRNSNGSFWLLGENGFWWSSSEFTTGKAWFRTLGYWDGKVYRFDDDKGCGQSVRCLRD